MYAHVSLHEKGTVQTELAMSVLILYALLEAILAAVSKHLQLNLLYTKVDKEDAKNTAAKGKKRKSESAVERESISAEKLVKIQIPSTLKKHLVDDWEFVTQQDKDRRRPPATPIDHPPTVDTSGRPPPCHHHQPALAGTLIFETTTLAAAPPLLRATTKTHRPPTPTTTQHSTLLVDPHYTPTDLSRQPEP
ncbi:hypothetical protein Cgig2_011097 [Carnegiea gigantea]|uniref:MRG domain-containing protein n=1 Tax=Carnegiea gigantea TaxID=171969 RepID=A0A9Q1GTK6_9CARY|nr:hypothetical protein Cgig2_011097 [Carnegiea gigantea]